MGIQGARQSFISLWIIERDPAFQLYIEEFAGQVNTNQIAKTATTHGVTLSKEDKGKFRLFSTILSIRSESHQRTKASQRQPRPIIFSPCSFKKHYQDLYADQV